MYNQRVLAAALSANALTSPGDMKQLGVADAANPAKAQAQAVMNKVLGERRKDNFFLKVKATVSADAKDVMFFNPLGLNTNATSGAGVTFSTNCPGGYTQLQEMLKSNLLLVRGVTVKVGDEDLFDNDWFFTDGDVIRQQTDEFNTVLDAAKQQITDDPKTRILPIEFGLDGYTGIFVKTINGATTAQTIQLILNVVGIPTRLR